MRFMHYSLKLRFKRDPKKLEFKKKLTSTWFLSFAELVQQYYMPRKLINLFFQLELKMLLTGTLFGNWKHGFSIGWKYYWSLDCLSDPLGILLLSYPSICKHSEKNNVTIVKSPQKCDSNKLQHAAEASYLRSWKTSYVFRISYYGIQRNTGSAILSWMIKKVASAKGMRISWLFLKLSAANITIT